MTLIVSIITNKKAFLICDKMHSLDGSQEKPVEATFKMGGQTIKVKSPKIRITTGTKTYNFNKEVIFGGAGTLEKIQKFVESIKDKQIDSLPNYTSEYYVQNKDNSPDQLMILSNIINDYRLDIFQLYQQDEFNSFYYYYSQIKEENIGVLAIGSGAPLFLTLYNQIKTKTIENYKLALKKGTYDKWEIDFLEKIKEMYLHVSKYDDSVSADINVESV